MFRTAHGEYGEPYCGDMLWVFMSGILYLGMWSDPCSMLESSTGFGVCADESLFYVFASLDHLPEIVYK